MLIHSVTPCHLLIEQPEIPQCSFKKVDGGYLEGFDTPEGFQISRVHSTDPSMYLRPDFQCGQIYKQE